MNEFDLMVIGSGSGLEVSSEAAERGLSVAVVTPMAEDGSIDFAALDRHAGWLIEQGADVLMPCGTTGESSTLDADEQRRVIATCVQAADGRVPVFAGAGTNSTERSAVTGRWVMADAENTERPAMSQPCVAQCVALFKALAYIA